MPSRRHLLSSLLVGTLHAGCLLLVALELGYSVGPSNYSVFGLSWRYGGLVVALGLSERARASRLVTGVVGILFVAQGVYEALSRTSWIGPVIGLLYGGLGATVVLYQSGVAPWGTPGGTTDSS